MKLLHMLLLFFVMSVSVNAQKNLPNIEYAHLINLIESNKSDVHDNAITYLDKTWKSEYRIMVLELMYFSQNYRLQVKLLSLLEKHTKQNFRFDFNAWYAYLWNEQPQLSSYYHKFKARLHEPIDSRFSKYFLNRQDKSRIRFDEIRWGGVEQDGIPPLRNPEMVSVNNAGYLNDNDVVFGIAVNGDFRAYPKRILAWHELFTDTVGGEPVAGVYCTLCGTVILYKTTHKGVNYNLGTSGFLYRSNKLMYDKATQSLWNTLLGEPVVGPLINKGIVLDYLSVVTTTWGEWKQRYPETSVLSLNTGFRRNYDEGNAYKDYFATDDLMFNVPSPDASLKNKQPILAIRFKDTEDEPLAISTQFLNKNKVYHDVVGSRRFVVFTDASGANRVYNSEDMVFIKYDKKNTVIDDNNVTWTLHEDRLENTNGDVLKRIPTFNAFWFGWKAVHPNTRLVK